jgi:chromosome segregation ATPase
MGHPLPLVPGVHLSEDEAKKLKSLAKKGVGIDKRAEEYRKKIAALDEHIRALDGEINALNQSIRSIARERDTWKANYERLWAEVKEFIGAIRRIPERLRAFIAEHLPQQKNQNREVR